MMYNALVCQTGKKFRMPRTKATSSLDFRVSMTSCPAVQEEDEFQEVLAAKLQSEVSRDLPGAPNCTPEMGDKLTNPNRTEG